MGDHVHSFGPRGRMQCSCGMIPGEMTPTAARELVRAAQRSLEATELALDRAGYREAAREVYDCRLQLSEALAALPEGDDFRG